MRLTLKDLELLKTATAYNGTQHKEICGKATLELIEYKKIEEELGIDLITLFKVLKAKELYWRTNKYSIVETTFEDEEWYKEIKYYEGRWVVNLVWHALADDELLSDYGKTWALTKEELLC